MLYGPFPEPNLTIAGYAALIIRYNLQVPTPAVLSAISQKHRKYTTKNWQIFTPRYAPEDTLFGHLVFSLRYEGLDLAVLHALFLKANISEFEAFIQKEPNGKYTRRIWFLYEFLQEKTLAIPDAKSGNYIDLLDNNLQYAGPSRPSKRHRVKNNLPGVKHCCPLIRRTKVLDHFISQGLNKEIIKNSNSVPEDLLLRASAYLLLGDSKASYIIEGETPARNREEKWAAIIGQAGQTALTHDLLNRLQNELLIESRFIRLGYRLEGGFIGEHDRLTNQPIPRHISANINDLDQLMNGLLESYNLLKHSDFPPVLTATIIAFAFVFIHPFEDGNGRLHRYLFHHVLVETGFASPGLSLPISSVILKQLSAYRDALEAFSKPRLSLIEWRSTGKGNVKIMNDTLDLYRFFDATEQAEFFYGCLHEAVTKALPEELAYLKKIDQMKFFIKSELELPDYKVSLLIQFLTQNKGVLSERALKKEFSGLTKQELKAIQSTYKKIFGYDN